MSVDNKIKEVLFDKGVDFVCFVDISELSPNQNKQFSSAILLGIALSPEYLQKVSSTADYVQNMIANELIIEDEFYLKEIKTDSTADYLADYLRQIGYEAFSQSESNLENDGCYNKKFKSTPLPHKTLALMAGLGWIGKNNLLVTPEYGCAISMCSVLTNAPLNTVWNLPTKSKCGDCNVCKNICSANALAGQPWGICTSRDRIIDVFKCNTCLKCLVHCSKTQEYIRKNR